MHIASITIATIITAVRTPEIPFMILKGTVIRPPTKPTIVIMLNSTNSVGISCPKKRLLSSINFFKTARPNH
jgi:hypothetical protein